MVSVFDDAAVDASASVDDVFGESLHITPMMPGRYTAAVADTSRAAFDIIGAFFDSPERIKMQSTKVGRDFFEQFVGAKCFISIDKDALDGLSIKKGDIVTRGDIAGTPQFEVNETGELEVQRILFSLVAVVPAS